MNKTLLGETIGVVAFISYFNILEKVKLLPVGKGFNGGKWSWMRGVRDYTSSYQAVQDPRLEEFIESSEKVDFPIALKPRRADPRWRLS
jgi:hypothetical protein